MDLIHTYDFKTYTTSNPLHRNGWHGSNNTENSILYNREYLDKQNLPRITTANLLVNPYWSNKYTLPIGTTGQYIVKAYFAVVYNTTEQPETSVWKGGFEKVTLTPNEYSKWLEYETEVNVTTDYNYIPLRIGFPGDEQDTGIIKYMYIDKVEIYKI